MITRDQPTIFTPDVIAAVSAKREGNLSFHAGLDHQHVPAYRRAWLSSLGVAMEQTAVVKVNDPERWDIIHDTSLADAERGTESLDTAIIADALVTNQPGIALLLLTADCNPIILFDPNNRVLALAHAGWQSTDVHLAEKVVWHMQQQYGSKPADIRVYIGPAIKKESYVFVKPQQADWPAWKPFLSKAGEDGEVAIDLPGYNRQQLLDAGVLADHIQVCPTDTATDPDYFSHYRATRSGDLTDDGRFATVCMMK